MKHIAFRLKKGDFLKEGMLERCKDIEAGVLLSIVGGLDNAVLRMPGASSDHQPTKDVDGPLEIVGGTGTFSKNGAHLHISVSDSHGEVWGGHLKGGCRVRSTAEIVIGVLDDVFERVMDSDTGFKELEVKSDGAPE